jgi:hypothetical protein
MSCFVYRRTRLDLRALHHAAGKPCGVAVAVAVAMVNVGAVSFGRTRERGCAGRPQGKQPRARSGEKRPRLAKPGGPRAGGRAGGGAHRGSGSGPGGGPSTPGLPPPQTAAPRFQTTWRRVSVLLLLCFGAGSRLRRGCEEGTGGFCKPGANGGGPPSHHPPSATRLRARPERSLPPVEAAQHVRARGVPVVGQEVVHK